MPDQTTEIPEAAVQAALEHISWGSFAVKRNEVLAILAAAAPLLTAPLREELEKVEGEREKQTDRALGAEASARWEEERAHSAERWLEEARDALLQLALHYEETAEKAREDGKAELRVHGENVEQRTIRGEALSIAQKARTILATLPEQVDGEGEKQWAGYDEITLRVSRASAIRLEQHLTKTFGESRIVHEIRAQLAGAASTSTPEERLTFREFVSCIRGTVEGNDTGDEDVVDRIMGLVTEAEHQFRASPTPEQPEEPTCGGSRKLSVGVDRDFDSGMLEADDEKDCPGCKDCSAQEAGGEEEYSLIGQIREEVGYVEAYTAEDEDREALTAYRGVLEERLVETERRRVDEKFLRETEVRRAIAEREDHGHRWAKAEAERDSRLTEEAVRAKLLRDEALFAVACKRIGIDHDEKENKNFDAEQHARELVEAALDAAFGDDR